MLDNDCINNGGFMRYTVRLGDDTVGEMEHDNIEDAMGDEVTVSLRDENGNPVEVDGILEEVLEEHDY